MPHAPHTAAHAHRAATLFLHTLAGMFADRDFQAEGKVDKRGRKVCSVVLCVAAWRACKWELGKRRAARTPTPLTHTQQKKRKQNRSAPAAAAST